MIDADNTKPDHHHRQNDQAPMGSVGIAVNRLYIHGRISLARCRCERYRWPCTATRYSPCLRGFTVRLILLFGIFFFALLMPWWHVLSSASYLRRCRFHRARNSQLVIMNKRDLAGSMENYLDCGSGHIAGDGICAFCLYGAVIESTKECLAKGRVCLTSS
jgi:hypothetical protein